MTGIRRPGKRASLSLTSRRRGARRASVLLAGGKALMVAAASILLSLPAAASHDQPGSVTPVTLYFHAIAGEGWPVNTQRPPDGQRWLGTGRATATCVGLPRMQGSDGHTVMGYSTPSFVEYGTPDGQPRIQPERGLPMDVELDVVTPWTMTWYLATNAGAGAAQAPVPAAQVGLTVEVRAAVATVGDDFEQGGLLAQGTATPRTLQPGAPGHTVAADGAHVYAIEVTLEKSSPVIPGATGYEVRIQPFTDSPCPEGTLLPPYLGSFSDADHRPRMQLGILNPLGVQRLHAQVAGDDVLLHLLVHSAWGAYDVNATSATLEAAGPGPVALERAAVIQRVREHGHVNDPVEVTWVWPSGAHAQGNYTFSATIGNLQGTATAHAVGAFDAGERTTPWPGPTAAMGCLAAALWLSRNGRRRARGSR